MSLDIGVWIGALLTLGIFSFLYRDNPFYKLCESIFVGVSAGYWFCVFFFDNMVRKFYFGVFPSEAGIEPKYFLIVGAVLGALMLTRLIPSIGWISRWPLSFIVGATAGLYMMLFFVSNGLNQVADTMLPLYRETAGGDFDPAETLGTILVFIGTFTGLIYFFFSKEHKGLFGGAARVGIFFLMVTFGAAFGYTVMSRMSLLIGRMDFLFRDWLGLLG